MQETALREEYRGINVAGQGERKWEKETIGRRNAARFIRSRVFSIPKKASIEDHVLYFAVSRQLCMTLLVEDWKVISCHEQVGPVHRYCAVATRIEL